MAARIVPAQHTRVWYLRDVQIEAMGRFARWRYAAKVASWPKLIVPTLLGQSLGFALCGQLGTQPSWLAFVGGLWLTLLNLAYLVFLNDYGDREIDGLKRRMYPTGCSPKTIPDGILEASRLRWAGWASILVYLSSAHWLAWQLGLNGLPAFAWVSVAAIFCYTFIPGLNYRGGGELLEGLGTGLVLPLTHLYLQAGPSLVGPLPPASLVCLLPWSLFCFASAVASGLSDECSDRIGGKRTVASLLGNRRARALADTLAVLACLAWTVILGLGDELRLPLWAVALVLVCVVVPTRRMLALSPHARSECFQAQAQYKQALHRAMWWSTVAFAILYPCVADVAVICAEALS